MQRTEDDRQTKRMYFGEVKEGKPMGSLKATRNKIVAEDLRLTGKTMMEGQEA